MATAVQRRGGRSWGILVLAGAVGGFGAFLWLFPPRHQHGTSLEFVGPEVCRECHENQFDSWAKTRMANSFEVLKPGARAEAKLHVGLDPDADYSREEACLRCHTTGYGQVGGFESIEKTPEMAGVTCEACHGPGGRYAGTVMSPKSPTFSTSEAVEAGLVYPPKEPVCLGCHNEDSPFIGIDYEFDYERRVELGTHDHFRLKFDHGSAR